MSQSCGDLSCEIRVMKAGVLVRLRETVPGGPGVGCGKPVVSVFTGGGGSWWAEAG